VPVSFESSFDAKEQVRRAIDIVELVGDYVPLERDGRGYKGLCPWHDDARPSLKVNPERQSFKCWVCDIGGDIFSFFMKMEGLSFPEALAMLAERAGIPLKPSGSGSAGPASDEKQLWYRAMAWAEQQYHAALVDSPQGKPALEYLTDRGITPASIHDFHLGFAPAGWDWLLSRARGTSFTPAVLEKMGLVSPRSQGSGHYDRFRGRVLFSIRDAQGRPVAFGGRILPGSDEGNAAKYINSPETPLFSKSQLLYGLDVARDAVAKERAVLVMEGYTDCVVAHQHGFRNAVAVLGTALGERHVKLLRRFADRIILVLDGDEAGRRRTDEILDLFVAEQVDLRIVTLPGGLDPCDLLEQRGSEAFSALIDEGIDALEHKFRGVSAGVGESSGTHEASTAVEAVLATLAKSPRLAASSSSAARLREDHILNRLSRRFGVGEPMLRSRLASLRRTSRGDRRRTDGPSSEPVPRPAPLDPTERELVEVTLVNPDRIGEILAEVDITGIQSPPCREIMKRVAELAEAGIEPAFDRLLLEFDDVAMKSLLVELDEQGHARGHADPAIWLRNVLAGFHRRRLAQEQRSHAATLAGQKTDDPAAVDLLRRIIDGERNRQGISTPTDG